MEKENATYEQSIKNLERAVAEIKEIKESTRKFIFKCILGIGGDIALLACTLPFMKDMRAPPDAEKLIFVIGGMAAAAIAMLMMGVGSQYPSSIRWKRREADKAADGYLSHLDERKRNLLLMRIDVLHLDQINSSNIIPCDRAS